MQNQELDSYINEQRRGGVSDEVIKQTLLTNGWPEEIVGNALDQITETEPYNSVSKPRKYALLIILASAAIITLLVVGYSLISSEVSDDQTPANKAGSMTISMFDDSDLMLEKVMVPDAENAYFELIKLEDVYSKSGASSSLLTAMATGETWNNALAEELLSLNEDALNTYTNAASRTIFINPTYADPRTVGADSTLPSLNEWLDMARYSAIRAHYLANLGQHEAAIEEATKSIKIGHAIESSRASFIEILVGGSMRTIGLQALRTIATQHDIEQKILHDIAMELGQYTPDPNGLIESYKLDYQIVASVIDKIAAGDEEIITNLFGEVDREQFQDSSRFDTDTVKAYFADYTRKYLKNITSPCNQYQNVSIPKLSQSAFSEENDLGRQYHDTVASSMSRLIISNCTTNSLLAITQATIGLRSFSLTKGRYPESLSELVPQYLPLLPKDPFNPSKTIQYSANKKIVYSIGEDLIDSGGNTGGATSILEMPDITVSVDFK